jgi:hypothetical protein
MLINLVVYIILEAHQRSGEPEVGELWDLIRRVYENHDDLMTAVTRPDVDFLARITVAAWQNYDLELRQQRSDAAAMETPAWIRQLCHNFNLPIMDPSTTDGQYAQSLNDELLPANFDFDIIDWSAWDALH